MKKLFLSIITLFTLATVGAEPISTKELILEHAKSDEYQKHGYPLLAYAISKNYHHMALRLLNSGLDPAEYAHKKYTNALVEAILIEDNEIVELLLQKGCDPNERVNRSHTNWPLRIAVAVNNDTEVFKTLLSFGADPLSTKGLYLENVITRTRNSIKWFDLLFDIGVLPRTYNDEEHFESAVAHAASCSPNTPDIRSAKLYMLQKLISMGEDVNVHGVHSSSPIQRAANCNFLDAVRILLENNADIGEASTHKWSIKTQNTRTGRIEKEYYSQKISVIGSVVSGQRAFSSSIEEAFSIIELLLENKADINAPSLCQFGQNQVGSATHFFSAPPLFQTIIDRNFALAEFLIDNGADAEIVIENSMFCRGQTPLLWSVTNPPQSHQNHAVYSR